MSTTAPPTAAIAAFATRRRTAQEVAGSTSAVAAALLDTVGVAIAGQATDTARILGGWIQDTAAPGEVPVWGSGLRVSAPDAALLNGTAGHALDWDDAAPSMPMHPSTVLMPALLAQAGVADVSGESFAQAYVVGAAVFWSVSEALPVNTSVDLGWHNTATSGRIAAVAALANLTGADRDATARALGLVASMSSGSVSNFGTMTKPLHAGLAARDALMAVSLAGRGFTANAAQLEHKHGFFAMHGAADPARLAALPERLEHWERSWLQDLSIKRYPCCYGTHHAADAALEVRDAVDVADIARIDASIYAADLGILTKGLPTTGLAAKFSLEYVVAVALTRGAVTLADFEQAALDDTAVLDLAAKVHYVGDPEASARFADLRITLHDGRTLTQRVDITRGDARNPMTPEELRAKFVGACASAGWPEQRAHDAADRLLAATDSPSIAELSSMLSDADRATSL